MKRLSHRAELLRAIRTFFAERGVMEVETPLLQPATVTDPHLHSFTTGGKYLQTSPEYAMKRLLCAGSGDIYQICKAFRDEESGRRHSPEFTMLEWYRLGFDHHDLMREMDVFLQTVSGMMPAQKTTYQALFLKYVDCDPHTASLEILRACAKRYGVRGVAGIDDKDTWLQLIMSDCIEPHLGNEAPVFVYDFPASQAALARVRLGPPAVASRFEVYIRGMEIANGFHELTDPIEQAARFTADLEKRRSLGLPEVPVDHAFLGALGQGLPACAGVAVGVDRLLMAKCGAEEIKDLIFP